MKAFVCSIGEPTTPLCVGQLRRYGFDVVLLDQQELWKDKYIRFLNTADDDCIRVDADIVCNSEIVKASRKDVREAGMAQFMVFDVYSLDRKSGVVFYSKETLEKIKKDIGLIDWRRPEATAWRIPSVNEKARTFNIEVGIHGLLPTRNSIMTHRMHRQERKQIVDEKWLEALEAVI